MGMRVGYYSLAKLLQKLHLAKADGSYAKELSKLERWQLLILDDWGLQALNLNARMTILQIIEHRHGKHSTIITSQLPVAKWYDYIGEPTLADAILDRILHQTHRIELKGESMRKRKNLSQNNSEYFIFNPVQPLIHRGLIFSATPGSTSTVVSLIAK